MRKNESGVENGNDDLNFLDDIYFRTPRAKYGIEMPLGDGIDDVRGDWVAGWMDQSYGPGGDGFQRGE